MTDPIKVYDDSVLIHPIKGIIRSIAQWSGDWSTQGLHLNVNRMMIDPPRDYISMIIEWLLIQPGITSYHDDWSNQGLHLNKNRMMIDSIREGKIRSRPNQLSVNLNCFLFVCTDRLMDVIWKWWKTLFLIKIDEHHEQDPLKGA